MRFFWYAGVEIALWLVIANNAAFTGFFLYLTMYRKQDTPENPQDQSSSQQAKCYSFSKSSNNRFICL